MQRRAEDCCSHKILGTSMTRARAFPPGVTLRLAHKKVSLLKQSLHKLQQKLRLQNATLPISMWWHNLPVHRASAVLITAPDRLHNNAMGHQIEHLA